MMEAILSPSTKDSMFASDVSWNHPNNTYFPVTADYYEYVFTNIAAYMIVLIQYFFFSLLRSCITFSWHAPVYLLSPCWHQQQHPAAAAGRCCDQPELSTLAPTDPITYFVALFWAAEHFFPFMSWLWWRTEQYRHRHRLESRCIRSIKIVPRLAAVLTHTQERGRGAEIT